MSMSHHQGSANHKHLPCTSPHAHHHVCTYQVSAFVHQEDVILATMTVKEALFFAAQLKLPATLTKAEKQDRALAVAETLNLTKTLDSYVGDSMLKGIRWVVQGAHA